MARIEGGEEILKAAVAVVLPMKLLIGSLQETVPGKELRFRLGREGHVRGRGLRYLAQRDNASGERRADFIPVHTVADQKARAGDRREGNRGLEFWVIAAAS